MASEKGLGSLSGSGLTNPHSPALFPSKHFFLSSGRAGPGSSSRALLVLHQLSLKTARGETVDTAHSPTTSRQCSSYGHGNPWATPPFRENSPSIEKPIRHEMEKSSLKNTKSPDRSTFSQKCPLRLDQKAMGGWAIYFLGSDGSCAHFWPGYFIGPPLMVEIHKGEDILGEEKETFKCS